MPLYEFINKSGTRLLIWSTVGERNRPRRIRGGVFQRVRMPSRVSVVNGSQRALPPGGMRDTVAGYYKAEQKLGAKFKSEFTKDQIKKAWSPE